MKLSVIIPGYNTPNEWWERCLRSVLAALPDDGEVICVDDGSKVRPELEKIVGDISGIGTAEVKVLYLEKNVGQAAARNRALEIARGDYVTFVDSDDVVYPEVYKRCLQLADSGCADIVMFGARTEWCTSGLYKTDVMPLRAIGTLSIDELKSIYDNCLYEYVWNKLYRRDFLERRKIRFAEWMCPGEDTEFNLKCQKHNPKWAIIDYVGYCYYRMDGTSLSRYLPNYVESEKSKAAAWKEIFDCPMAEWSENKAIGIHWTNMWRRNSPFTFIERYRFAKEHNFSFLKMVICTFLRKYCYIRPVRRMKIKRMYPMVKEVRMRRFEAIMNIPSPYRVYLFEVLDKILAERGCSFEAHFMAKGHAERPKSWLNPKMSFKNKYWKDFGKGCHHFNPGWILRSWFVKPDVLLVGSPFDTFTGICAAFFACAKVKCTWVEGQTKTPGKMGGLIGAFKRLVLSRFKYVAVPGSDAAKYIEMHQALTKLKMPKPIFLPNLIDESRFKPRGEWPKEEIEKCRARFCAGIEDKVCLIPARLDTVKGLVPFIEALDAGLINDNRWRIVIMGQGPLKSDIMEAAKMKGIEQRLTILDYVPYAQMPTCYAAADLFLLPSLHDPNPLSVPEALHSALPVAISDRCGNVEEGCTDGENGWILPVGDKVGFERKMREVFASTKEALVRKGVASKKVNAEFWNSYKAIEAFVDNAR